MFESLVVMGLISLCVGPLAALFCIFKNSQTQYLLDKQVLNQQVDTLNKKIKDLELKVEEVETAVVIQSEWDKKLKEIQEESPFMTKVQL